MKRMALAAAALAAMLAACSRGARLEGFPIAGATKLPAITLVGADTLQLDRTGGRVTLLTFGFTHCPDICPTTLADWQRVRRQLGADARDVRFVWVSVDHRRDTPAMADSFASRFDAAFIGVAADYETQRRMFPFFQADAKVQRNADDSGWEVAHTPYSYLIDARGRVREYHRFASEPDAIVRDLRRLLAEARRDGARAS